jgi:hypothetical protein
VTTTLTRTITSPSAADAAV